MKKKWMSRALLGFPLGIAIGHVIEVLPAIGFGEFSPCVPAFVEMIGSEANAVAIQMLLCGVVGASWSGTSVIWETDWGFTRQTILHFLINAGISLPIAYFLHWMNHTLSGFLPYLLLWAGIYFAIWWGAYVAWKMRLKRMNQRLREQ